MRFGVLFAIAGLLSGCAVVDRIDARNQYQDSVGRYKACLAANAADPRACEASRLAMEADERRAGHGSSADLTVRSR